MPVLADASASPLPMLFSVDVLRPLVMTALSVFWMGLVQADILFLLPARLLLLRRLLLSLLLSLVPDATKRNLYPKILLLLLLSLLSLLLSVLFLILLLPIFHLSFLLPHQFSQRRLLLCRHLLFLLHILLLPPSLILIIATAHSRSRIEALLPIRNGLFQVLLVLPFPQTV